MVVFAFFFATYLFNRGQHPALFRTGQRSLDRSYGAADTLLLLTSSLFIATAVRTLRSGFTVVASRLVVGGFVCGGGFAALKVIEWTHHLHDGLTPSTSSFFLYFYILTGLHFFHFLIGMGLLVFIWTQTRRAVLSDRRLAFVEGAACFWHLVDLLWIVLFPLLYLMT